MPEVASMQRYNLIVVCGPTATGKTALAVALAARLGSSIISCDSRQVYRGLDIGTGKDLHEYYAEGKPVPYYLIDIVEPTVVFTLYDYQKAFYSVFTEMGQSGIPILVGGSGLYLEAVLKGYLIPQVPEDAELRERLMLQDHSALIEQLRKGDTKHFFRTDLSSKKRVIRALEVTLKGGGKCSDAVSPPEIRPFIIGTQWDRAELRERIDHRLAMRLEQGMIEEVRTLRAAGISDERLALLGMEYRYSTSYLRGELTIAEMTVQLRHRIHQFAKRQETYFRGMQRRGLPICWVPEASVAASIVQMQKAGIL